MKPPEPLIVTGTHNLLSEGIKALEAFQTCWGDSMEIAEFRLYENMPIEVVVANADDAPLIEFETWRWNGAAWITS